MVAQCDDLFRLIYLQIGYVMFYVRAPVEGGQDHIANALSVLWQVSCFAFIPLSFLFTYLWFL